MSNTNDEFNIQNILSGLVPEAKTNPNLEEASKLAGEILVQLLTIAKEVTPANLETFLPKDLSTLTVLATIARG